MARWWNGGPHILHTQDRTMSSRCTEDRKQQGARNSQSLSTCENPKPSQIKPKPPSVWTLA